MLKKLSIYFFIVCVLVVLGSVYLNLDAAKKLEAAKQRFVELGAPMTLEEALFDPVPDSENAAPLYLELEAFVEETDVYEQANSRIEEGVFGDDYSKDWDHILRMDLTDEQWDVVEVSIVKLEEALYFELIDEIVARPSFRPDWDYSEGPSMLIPEVGLSRNAARYLLARAALSCRSGEHDDSLEALEKVFRLSEHLCQGQNLICLLTGYSIRSLAYDSLQALSREGVDLSELNSAVFDLSVFDFWIPALDLERVGMGDTVFKLMLEGSDEELELLFFQEMPAALRVGRIVAPWFFVYDYSRYLSLSADARMDAHIPASELEARSDVVRSKMRRYDLITRIFLPGTYRVQRRIYEVETHDLLAQTGIALAAYRRERGRYPETLEALVPEYLIDAPMDPFSEEALVYRLSEAGYELYSVGADLVDNGGFERYLSSMVSEDIIWQGAGSILKRLPEEE